MPVTGYLTNQVVSDSTSGQYLQTAFPYDFAGNVTNKAFGFCSDPTNAWTYGWNTANHLNVLTNVVDPEGVTVEYEYTNATGVGSSRYLYATRA